MSAFGLQIRHLSFHGPKKPPACLDFGPGLNVIYGASEAGKSFIVETIDFMLGGKPPLREIREGVGYDKILLGLETPSGELFTVQRSVEGGAFRAYDGLHREPPSDNVASWTLAEQHSDRNQENLSSYLLERCNLSGKRIRKNKSGDTNSLSFRNLARLIIVNETEIVESRSPLKDGNPTNDTANFATFKLLLTGIDDSALTSTKADSREEQSREAQIGLLDQLLEEYRQRLGDLTSDPTSLDGQLQRIEAALSQHVEQLTLSESEYRSLADRRGDIRKRLEEGRERRAEIDSLLARFDLLDRHYQSDLARLRALEEGGTLFEVMEQGSCPLCGADPGHHRRTANSLADVGAVVAGARSEIAKIDLLRRELAETVAGLMHERSGFDRNLPRIEEQLRKVSDNFERLVSPKVNRLRSSYKELADKRGEVREALSMSQTIQDIERRRAALETEPDGGREAAVSDGDLPASVAEAFSIRIENILKAWHFPETGRVHFDSKMRDLVIAGKHRSARGKGLRAITRAAFTLGILDFCRASSKPHPGFVILDSPLLAYREPEGVDDDLRGTDLKEQFYTFLAAWQADRQVLIVENMDPPEAICSRPQTTFLSGNPGVRRSGFFPVPPSDEQEGSGRATSEQPT